MVTWESNQIPHPHLADPSAVRRVEQVLRVRFPADYLAIATLHQGASPTPAKIDAFPNGGVTAMAHLLHFEDTPGASNILNRHSLVAGVLQKGEIPFAEDIGGDLFCFSFRTNGENPPVIFWSVDTGAVPLAANFTAFVALLRD